MRRSRRPSAVTARNPAASRAADTELMRVALSHFLLSTPERASVELQCGAAGNPGRFRVGGNDSCGWGAGVGLEPSDPCSRRAGRVLHQARAPSASNPRLRNEGSNTASLSGRCEHQKSRGKRPEQLPSEPRPLDQH